MASAVRTYDLRPCHAERPISMSRDGAGDTIEIRGPPAAGFEFVGRFVERGIACGTSVGARGGHVFIVSAGVRSFGSFLTKNAKLF